MFSRSNQNEAEEGLGNVASFAQLPEYTTLDKVESRGKLSKLIPCFCLSSAFANSNIDVSKRILM